MTQLNFAIAASLPQPALDWMFRVRMPADFSREKNPDPNILQKITTLLRPEDVIAESVSFSFRHAAAQPRFHYGKNENFAGFTDLQGCSMNLYETYDYRTTQYLKMWKSFVYNSEKRAYYPSTNYKRNITIHIYEDMQSEKPVVIVTLVDAWPGEVSGYDYAYANDGRIVLAVPFNVDEVELEIPEQSQNSEILNSVLSTIGLR